MVVDKVESRVLFISHIFPPDGGPGVQRSAKFVKYLPQMGWDPVVLTTDRSVERVRDSSLLAEIPPGTAIVRAHTMEPDDDWRGVVRYLIWGPLTPLSVPDLGNWWFPWAIPAALREIRRRPVAAIYATGSPYSSHVLGAILKACTGLPLVLDFRDEWTIDPLYWVQRRGYWKLFKPVESRMQRWAVRKADRVILVTDSAYQAFVRAYGDLDKFVVIRNGFDEPDFEHAAAPDLPENRFHVVYSGSTAELNSRPAGFLQAAREAIDRAASLRDNLQIHFVGEFDRESREWVSRLQLETYVDIVGPVSHRKSVGYLTSADVLLLISRLIPTRVAGKAYEYLGAQKPVLALTPPGAEVVRLFDQAGVGYWVDPEDITGIANTLIGLAERWRSGGLHVPSNSAALRQFTRRYLTARLAEVLDTVTK